MHDILNGIEGWRGEADTLPAEGQDGSRRVSKGDIFSGGAETAQGWGAVGPSQAERARGQGGSTGVASVGSSTWGGTPGLGQTGTRQGTQDRGVPSCHLTHRNSFSSRHRGSSGTAFSGLCRSLEGWRAGRQAVLGESQRDVIRRVKRPREGGPGTLRSKEAAGARPAGAGPTRHCGPGSGAERAHSGLGDAVCPHRSAPGAGLADSTASRGVKGMGRDQTRRGGRGGVNELSGGRLVQAGVRSAAGGEREALASRARGQGGPRGRRRSRDRCLSVRAGDEARSPAGVDVPTSCRRPGRQVRWTCQVGHDMVRCDGEDRGGASGLPEHLRLVGLRREAGLFLYFLHGVGTLRLPSGLPEPTT
ncbi:PE-PGRS family protein PE_PGRS4 [Pongo abelii]|uniref:PE-PGRS family protein PE_PGRS4 n=1 Tax=Pongo abelii TaxID=9601 RepID=UPI0023E1AC0A|nr:spidroin-2 [Pongo abelii]XP_054294672.1 spidroin-2-like [Pongo pygmaeus]